jgi:hypothetical protein
VQKNTQNIHLLLQTLFVTEIYAVILFVCHLPFYQNNYWEFKGRGGFFFFFVTKLATYGYNLCYSANVGNGLLTVGWCGVKRSTVERGSSVHESPSFVCLFQKHPQLMKL